LLSTGSLRKCRVRRNALNSSLSRALIRLRKAGLAEHNENSGTKSSNPLPSSGESDANSPSARGRDLLRKLMGVEKTTEPGRAFPAAGAGRFSGKVNGLSPSSVKKPPTLDATRNSGWPFSKAVPPISGEPQDGERRQRRGREDDAERIARFGTGQTGRYRYLMTRAILIVRG
jgi:hypothetical protein